MTTTVTATAAGSWALGDLTVNRLGFGAMRLMSNADGTPSDRDSAIGVGAGAGNDAVEAVARAHGATPAQVRLAWTLHRGPNVLAIPGTGNPAHLEENVAAGQLRLSQAEMDTIG